MPIIQHKKICRHLIINVKVSGYLDPEERIYQHLQIDTLLFGKRIWTRTVHTDQIPSGCYYQSVCLGYTSWKSSRPDLVSEWQKARLSN
jgi:hypothetical protein